MGDYIVFPLIFFESITMLLWLHICFKQKLSESSKKLIFIITYVFYYIILTLLQADNYLNVVGILLIIIWVKFCFKKELMVSVLKIIIAMLGMGLSQILSLKIIEVINEHNCVLNLVGIYYVSGISCLVLSIFIYFAMGKGRVFAWKIDRYTVLVIIYIAIMLMFVKYDYETNNRTYSFMYITLFLSLAILLIVIVRGLRASNALEQKKLELELVRRYESTYKLLLSEMRRKQHDYKNQLIAVTSVECQESVQAYAKELLRDDLYTTITGGCDNPVLSGYLYTKCIEAESVGVNIIPKISLVSDNVIIPLYEIIEMLGILVDNAVEYLQEEAGNKNALVCVYNKDGKLHILVSNVSRYYSYHELSELFQLGYSNKGVNRGVGLYSLKKIVSKYKGDLSVQNIEKDNENHLQFKIII